MPRPKGSKNKARPQTINEQIAAVTAEIGALQEQLKQKRLELKRLEAEKEKEGQQQILDAVAASGKSVEEILALISGEARQV